MLTLTVLCQDGVKKEIEDVIPESNDKRWCAKNSLFTVDGISVFPAYGMENEPFAFAVNNSRVSNKLIYRLRDDRVIESSMSDYTFDKFRKVLSSNRNRILETLKEVHHYA